MDDGLLRGWPSKSAKGVDLIDGKYVEFYVHGPTGQRLDSNEVRIVETLPNSWQVHENRDAKYRYYFNKDTKKCCWEKPTELMMEIEKNPAYYWEECRLGQLTYYYNKKKKEVELYLNEEIKQAFRDQEQVKKKTSQEVQPKASSSLMIDGPLPGNSSLVTILPLPVPTTLMSSSVGIDVSDSIDGTSEQDLELLCRKKRVFLQTTRASVKRFQKQNSLPHPVEE